MENRFTFLFLSKRSLYKSNGSVPKKIFTCSDVVLNQLSIAGLNLYNYVPQDYEIRKYGEQKKVTQPAATDLIGQKAPDWMLKDMYEKPVALSEFKSKVLLVNLTGIGCGACHASIPFLNGLKGKFNAGEFEVVSIETWGREPHSLRTYADKNQINYSFLCGGNSLKGVLYFNGGYFSGLL